MTTTRPSFIFDDWSCVSCQSRLPLTRNQEMCLSVVYILFSCSCLPFSQSCWRLFSPWYISQVNKKRTWIISCHLWSSLTILTVIQLEESPFISDIVVTPDVSKRVDLSPFSLISCVFVHLALIPTPAVADILFFESHALCSLMMIILSLLLETHPILSWILLSNCLSLHPCCSLGFTHTYSCLTSCSVPSLPFLSLSCLSIDSYRLLLFRCSSWSLSCLQLETLSSLYIPVISPSLPSPLFEFCRFESLRQFIQPLPS